MFLAHAARLQVGIRQLDSICAFLQADVVSRVPLHLQKSMYDMTLSSKFLVN